MKAFHNTFRLVVIFLLSISVITGFWPHTGSIAAGSQESEPIHDDGHSHWSAVEGASDFIIEAGDEGSVCREATGEESDYFAERSDDLVLSPINDLSASAEGLNIILRGTAQLDSYPHAKQAFLRAAATWQSLIQTSMTIIVDVDFGPKRFGQAYPTGVLGSTGTQSLGNAAGYLSLRSRMIAMASDPAKLALYNSLPAGSLPTEMGPITAFATPSATLRAVGEINAVANPTTETNFGSIPSIGFNSNFSFDFDPSDGIDSDKVDFDSVAVHELGHVLGFASQAGMKEIAPSSTLSASVWDLFRFRPGVSLAQFTTASRVLSSGGEQVFFAGGLAVSLSTGRPNGAGGDERQASHWKDDAYTGNYIGVMDPTLPKGKRGNLTANDIAVLDAICYKINPQALPPPVPGSALPVIDSITGALNGNMLAITINAADNDGDMAQLFSSLLDESNRVVAVNPSFNIGGDASPLLSVVLNLPGMDQFPAAMKISVTVVDSKSNRSNTAVFDFSVADAGGPNLRSGSFDPSGLLSLKGGPFTGELKLEVNGVVVGPPLRIKKKGGGSKLKIAGTKADLNLRNGANRIRMLNNGLRSNILIITI